MRQMRVIRAELSPNDEGDTVANLHVILDALGLGDRVPEPDRAGRRYGEGTAAAVRSLQESLEVATEKHGVVDEPTAQAINAELHRRGAFRLVHGLVRDADDSPLVGNLLFAFDKDNVGD